MRISRHAPLTKLAFPTRVACAGALLCLSLGAQITIGPPIRIDNGRGTEPCNETTGGASRANPLEIVSGWNQYVPGGVRAGFGWSLDGGTSWTDAVIRPPAPFQASVEGDPMTCFDPRTGTIWAGAMAFSGNGGVYAARKDPGAANFQPATMIQAASGVDKGWMAAGPAPGLPNTTRVYCAYNFGVARSADMGTTWAAPVSLGSGLAFLPRVGPSGNVYVAWWNTGDKILLARSLDGGASYGPAITAAQRMDVWGIDSSRTPGVFRSPSLVGLAVDPNDETLYCVYPDTTSIESNGFNVDVYFTKSVNQGLNWSVPVVINGDAAAPPGDQFFPWIECDEDGGLHCLYFDSRGVVQNDTASVGLIDSYYSYSSDGGASWSEFKLTSVPANSGTAFPGGGFMGDYLGMSVAGHRAVPIYLDTPGGDSDVYTRVITIGPATEFCMGIGCPCGNDDGRAGCGNLGSDNQVGTGARLAAEGSANLAANDLVLRISGMKSGQNGLVYASVTSGRLAFGDGQRCLFGAVRRFPVRQANGTGVLSYGPSEVAGLVGGVVVGSTWHFQGWYRDPGGPCGSQFNLSNALTVTFQ